MRILKYHKFSKSNVKKDDEISHEKSFINLIAIIPIIITLVLCCIVNSFRNGTKKIDIITPFNVLFDIRFLNNNELRPIKNSLVLLSKYSLISAGSQVISNQLYIYLVPVGCMSSGQILTREMLLC